MFYLYLSFEKAVFREVTHDLFTFNAAPFNSMYFLSLLAVHELYGRSSFITQTLLSYAGLPTFETLKFKSQFAKTMQTLSISKKDRFFNF